MNEEYLQNLYSWIGSNDITFTKDVGFDQFKTKMQDPAYVQKMHGWIVSKDPTFGKDVPLDAFNNRIKGGASAAQPQTEVKKKRRYYGVTFGTWFFGFVRIS